MKKIMFCRKYDPVEAVKFKALGVCEIFQKTCAVCGTLVMISSASKQALDDDSEIIINCPDCAPKVPPAIIAMTVRQAKEMDQIRVKRQAQNN